MTQEKRQELENDGFIEISEEEWNYYTGNMGEGENGTGYIRDMTTGLPVSAPPNEPSQEEKIAELDFTYTNQKNELIKQYTDAQIHNDTEEMESISQEMEKLDSWYDKEYNKIKGV
jgi:hypothetical protein